MTSRECEKNAGNSGIRTTFEKLNLSFSLSDGAFEPASDDMNSNGISPAMMPREEGNIHGYKDETLENDAGR